MKPDISDEEILYRRVSALHVDDINQATSFAYKLRAEDSDGLSLFAASQKSVDEVLAGHESFGVVAIRAGDIRACGAIIERDTTDPAHVLVKPPIPRALRRALADRSMTLRPPKRRLQ